MKAVAMKNKESQTTADSFERSILYTTGPPSMLTHDQGSEMKAKFAAFEEENGIKVIKSSAHHSEGNGKAAAGVKKLQRKLLMFLENESIKDGD